MTVIQTAVEKTANYIIQYADEDIALVNSGKFVMAEFPNVDQSGDDWLWCFVMAVYGYVIFREVIYENLSICYVKYDPEQSECDMRCVG